MIRNTKRWIMEGMRPLGFERMSAVAFDAVLDELMELPEDIGGEREVATCARVTMVQDALRRAGARPGVTKDDLVLIATWQSLLNAAAIAMFLDIATLAEREVKLRRAAAAPKRQGAPS